ncbi:MAG: hypothetical protein ACK4EY_16310 [Flavipsychrobacter sp.]
MIQFKDLGISADLRAFTGEKIKIDRIINKSISVHDFKIEESKFNDKGNGKCLYMQIEVDGAKRVVFTGSTVLMEILQKVDKSHLPFQTIIEKDNDGRFFFT